MLNYAEVDPPDLILADIQMPGLDGLQAIKYIRASAELRLRNVPIIAITALAMPGDEDKCLKAGASLYVSKPISLPVLLQKINSIMQAGYPYVINR